MENGERSMTFLPTEPSFSLFLTPPRPNSDATFKESQKEMLLDFLSGSKDHLLKIANGIILDI